MHTFSLMLGPDTHTPIMRGFMLPSHVFLFISNISFCGHDYLYFKQKCSCWVEHLTGNLYRCTLWSYLSKPTLSQNTVFSKCISGDCASAGIKAMSHSKHKQHCFKMIEKSHIWPTLTSQPSSTAGIGQSTYFSDTLQMELRSDTHEVPYKTQ